MSLIKQENYVPGIVGLFNAWPNLGTAMSLLAETLLRSEGTLPKWFREYLAARVSHENDTEFCENSHMNTAMAYSEMTESQMADVIRKDAKLNALYDLGMIVSDNNSTHTAIRRIQQAKFATDEEIHYVVGIASAFCMFNRYVRGLGADTPQLTDKEYQKIGQVLSQNGYISSKIEPKEHVET